MSVLRNMAEFTIEGEEMIDRVAEKTESETTISVPETWEGEHVKVIRTDYPFALRNKEEFSEAKKHDGEENNTETTNNTDREEKVAQILCEAIREINVSDGAPVGDVIREVKKENITEETCRNVISDLKRRGEIYEPQENRLKCT